MSAAKTFISLLALCGIVHIYSCNMPACKNTDPVFDQFSPGSREYNTELAQQMRKQGAGGLRYWFDRYTERHGKQYITVVIQGDSLCARGEILVLNKAGLEHMIEMKGKSYSGAELRGLRIRVEQDSGKPVFVYHGLEKIID
jgi:hypothetical protein